jgi:DNA-directed RNA polymerase subunit F
MERETLETKYLPYAMARELVYKRVVEGETTMLLERVWDYLREFGQGDAAIAEKTLAKLREMGIPDDLAAVILSICPRSRGELLSIYQMRKDFSPSEAHFDPVLHAIAEFCSTTPFYEASESGE